MQQREFQQNQQANAKYAGAISGTELERLRLLVDQAELSIEQAQHQQEIARAKVRERQAAVQVAATRLEKHRIESAIAGNVVEVSVQIGQWVEPGQPIARLVSLDPIRIECFVDGNRYASELVGLPVRFEPMGLVTESVAAAPDSFAAASVRQSSQDESRDGPSSEPLIGHVSFVSPELHPVTGQVRLWATVPNPDHRVRPGMRGN